MQRRMLPMLVILILIRTQSRTVQDTTPTRPVVLHINSASEVPSRNSWTSGATRKLWDDSRTTPKPLVSASTALIRKPPQLMRLANITMIGVDTLPIATALAVLPE